MKDPAALLYIDKWLVSTKGMRADARGWYLNLILHQYDKGYLPNDIEELANYADVRISEYDRFKQVFEQVLKQKFEQDEQGNLINPFASEILRKREQFLEKRILSGKIGYVIKFIKANFKVSSKCIEWLKNELDFEDLDIKNEQVLKQVLEQKIKLYINKDENEDKSIIKNTYKKAVDFYFEFYETRVGLKPPFESREGKSVNEILKYIKNSMTEKSLPVTDESLLNGFQAVFKSLPKFYLEKLDINMIYNNYGKIIAEIRSKSGASEAEAWQRAVDNHLGR